MEFTRPRGTHSFSEKTEVVEQGLKHTKDQEKVDEDVAEVATRESKQRGLADRGFGEERVG